MTYSHNPILHGDMKYLIYDPSYEQDLVTDYDYVEAYEPKVQHVHETKHIHRNGQKCFKDKILEHVYDHNHVFTDIAPPVKDRAVRIYKGKSLDSH